jgi:hypothetical protein
MGLVKFGGGVAAISGKIGGTVFAFNRAGSYARNWKMPVNPQTSRQQTVRGNLATAAAAWESLTASQRSGWNAYAASVPVMNRLGESKYLSGFNMFLRTLTVTKLIGTTAVSDAPAIFTLPDPPSTFTPSVSEATQLVSVAFTNTDPWAAEAGGFMVVSCSMPFSPGKTYFGGQYRYVGKIVGATPTPPTTPKTFAVPWAVVEAQLIRVSCRILRADGRLSNPFRSANLTVGS